MDFNDDFFRSCDDVAQRRSRRSLVSPPTTAFDNLDLTKTEGHPERIPPMSDCYPGAVSDFHGLPSNPVCVYRTGDEWPAKNSQGRPILREARPVCNHPIQEVWAELSDELSQSLDSLGVRWTTIDPVCFAEQGGKAGPLHLWTGVLPRSLSFRDAEHAAVSCKRILANANFPEVEIAFRESIVRQYTGPRLLQHMPSVEHTADIRGPFTGTLGVQIAPEAAPYSEGTGALYLCEGGTSNRIFLLTARHVALRPCDHRNTLYHHKNVSQPCLEVLILGNKAYEEGLEDMMAKIARLRSSIDRLQTERDRLPVGDSAKVVETHMEYDRRLTEKREAIKAMDQLHSNITKHWSVKSQRVLGYVVYAPPISVDANPGGYTEDWALIDIDRDKIDWSGFRGNMLYLGNKISDHDFKLKMHPHRKSPPCFEYPPDGLLQVKGIVKDNELRQPTQRGADGEECLLVIKNGMATGVTIGRASGIESRVRRYSDYGIQSTSMEVAVYSYSKQDGPFSDPGDSGSIVVDGQGRIVGLLTGGCGSTKSTDISYLTPYFWLEERIKQAFPNSYLYPTEEEVAIST